MEFYPTDDLKESRAGSGINDRETVKAQYKTAEKLDIRISIHSKYSTNKQGFGNWIASHYDIRDGMSVLELGCGTGDMWTGKQETIRRCSRLVLSDFSEGMLEGIAVRTVKEFLQGETSVRRVIFNVFKDSDLAIYRELLAQGE